MATSLHGLLQPLTHCAVSSTAVPHPPWHRLQRPPIDEIRADVTEGAILPLVQDIGDPTHFTQDLISVVLGLLLEDTHVRSVSRQEGPLLKHAHSF
jgi:hypothetical protein